MKNTFSRGITFFGHFLTYSFGLLAVITLVSHLFQEPHITSDLTISWISPGKSYKSCQFFPNVDLTPQFNMNTKQVFLYLTVKTDNKEQMLWSKIVKNGSDYKFFNPEKSKYMFNIPDGNAVFELKGNVFPFVGFMKTVKYAEIKHKEHK